MVISTDNKLTETNEKPGKRKVTDREPLLWPAGCCELEVAWPVLGAGVCAAAASSSLPPKLVMKVIFSGPGVRERDRDSELDSDSGLREIIKKQKKFKHSSRQKKSGHSGGKIWSQLTVYRGRTLGCLSWHSWKTRGWWHKFNMCWRKPNDKVKTLSGHHKFTLVGWSVYLWASSLETLFFVCGIAGPETIKHVT